VVLLRRVGESSPLTGYRANSPWLLKPYCCQPPFLHCSLEVGKGGASMTVKSPEKMALFGGAAVG
jgi:hypothetical protein